MVSPRARSFSSQGLSPAPSLRSFSLSLTAQWARTAWLARPVLQPAYWATSPNSLDLLARVHTHKKAWLRQTWETRRCHALGFPLRIGGKYKVLHCAKHRIRNLYIYIYISIRLTNNEMWVVVQFFIPQVRLISDCSSSNQAKSQVHNSVLIGILYRLYSNNSTATWQWRHVTFWVESRLSSM